MNVKKNDNDNVFYFTLEYTSINDGKRIEIKYDFIKDECLIKEINEKEENKNEIN
jgi:hypothetical protein